MKLIRGNRGWAITGMMLVAIAALVLALHPAFYGPQAALANDVHGVNTPLVTVRFVGAVTTRSEIVPPVVVNPVAALPVTETAADDTVTFYFPPPDAPAEPAPPEINLVAIPDIAYHMEMLNQQAVPVTMVY